MATGVAGLCRSSMAQGQSVGRIPKKTLTELDYTASNSIAATEHSNTLTCKAEQALSAEAKIEGLHKSSH